MRPDSIPPPLKRLAIPESVWPVCTRTVLGPPLELAGSAAAAAAGALPAGALALGSSPVRGALPTTGAATATWCGWLEPGT